MPSKLSKRKWRRHRRKIARGRMIPAKVANDTSRRRKGKYASLKPKLMKRYHHYGKDKFDLSLLDELTKYDGSE